MAVGAVLAHGWMNVPLAHGFHHLHMAAQTDMFRGLRKLVRMSRGVRIVAGIAVTRTNRAVHILARELVGLVTLVTEAVRLTFERKSIITLMRIMTADTIATGDRTVQVLVQHHVTIAFMAGETKLFLIGEEREFVILPLDRRVTYRAYPGSHGAVHEGLSAHFGVAFARNASIAYRGLGVSRQSQKH